jgi:hypothetical protein
MEKEYSDLKSVAQAIPNVCKITRELIMRWEQEKEPINFINS